MCVCVYMYTSALSFAPSTGSSPAPLLITIIMIIITMIIIIIIIIIQIYTNNYQDMSGIRSLCRQRFENKTPCSKLTHGTSLPVSEHFTREIRKLWIVALSEHRDERPPWGPSPRPQGSEPCALTDWARQIYARMYVCILQMCVYIYIYIVNEYIYIYIYIYLLIFVLKVLSYFSSLVLFQTRNKKEAFFTTKAWIVLPQG